MTGPGGTVFGEEAMLGDCGPGAEPAPWWLFRSYCRRRFLAGLAGLGALALLPGRLPADEKEVRFGLTPVFLSSDIEIQTLLRTYLSTALARPVTLITRRTYQEITALLLSGQLDAAWICGYPYIQYRDRLSLLAVPVWRGRPLYQSYLIVDQNREAEDILNLRGDIHAYSDPDSNSGYLVTQAALAELGIAPKTFFRKTFFTYSHRNVVRAVAASLAESGSVDGYVWEVMSEIEAELTTQTRVLRKSEWLGFPPIACAKALGGTPLAVAIQKALTGMAEDPAGRVLLAVLRLDGFTPGEPSLFDGIARKYELIRSIG
jgi:ABC-type phosphate/phosphonate transport system substrate-binding protein